MDLDDSEKQKVWQFNYSCPTELTDCTICIATQGSLEAGMAEDKAPKEEFYKIAALSYLKGLHISFAGSPQKCFGVNRWVRNFAKKQAKQEVIGSDTLYKVFYNVSNTDSVMEKHLNDN